MKKSLLILILSLLLPYSIFSDECDDLIAAQGQGKRVYQLCESRNETSLRASCENNFHQIEALITRFEKKYPGVNFIFKYNTNRVNAYIKKDKRGVLNVSIMGGVATHPQFTVDVAALFIAHELAHHYGGPPYNPRGESCEGQADYIAVAEILPKIWKKGEYETRVDAAIAQMAIYLNVPNKPTPPEGKVDCGYPTKACRIATYHAASEKREKPECARTVLKNTAASQILDK